MTVKTFLLYTAALLVSLLLPVSLSAAGEDSGFSVGLLSSPKGFGPCFEFNVGKTIVCDSYLVADTYDLIFNDADKPGVRTSFCFNATLVQWDKKHCIIELFAGPGVYAGYGYDSTRGKGFYCALCADGGARLKLFPDITLVLSLEIGAGLHLSKDNSQSYNKLHMYKYGIYNSWIPQLSLLYRF